LSYHHQGTGLNLYRPLSRFRIFS